MAFFVYFLCAATSLMVSLLLFRQYQRSKTLLLFHSAIAFVCFSLANSLLFIDLIVLPQTDLKIFRNSATLIGVVFLLWGLIGGKEER